MASGEAISNLGWTALLEAVILCDGRDQDQQIVQALVDASADVNFADREGVTPIQHARSRGYEVTEKILVAAGADRKARNHDQ